MAVRFNIADITRFRMDGDIMTVTAVARHPGVLNYRQNGQVRGELVSPLFLRKLDSEGLPIIRKIAGIPTTNEHPAFLFKYKPEAKKALATGQVKDKIRVFKDGATEVTFDTWDAPTQTLIRTGEQPGVSLGYEVATVPAQGTWDGQPFQYEQAEPFYADHLATVRNPRAKDALIKRFDSEDDWACQVCTDGGAWDLERRQSLERGGMHGAFAGQDLSFPIASKQDVSEAWFSSFRTDSEDQVRSNILAIAKEYGWQDGLPSSAVAWAQERDISFSRTSTPKRKPMAVSITFDGGLTLEVPEAAASAIAALKTKHDALDAEVRELRLDAKKKMEEGSKAEEDKESKEEELAEVYDSYIYEKARADALEAESRAHVDGDEVTGRINAYMDAVAILAPDLKQALDALDINFDGTQSVLDIQKATLNHLRPDLKLDDNEVAGAYKLAKTEVIPATTRKDSTFNIVRGAIAANNDSSPKQARAARMDAEQKRSRMTLAQQREFDKQHA
jgi:hypothetical protein